VADHALAVRPGEEAQVLCRLLQAVREGEAAAAAQRALAVAARNLAGARTLAVVIGPRVFDCPGADRLVPELEALAAREGVTVLPLAHGANLRGALELGALGGVLPGPRPAAPLGRRRALSLAGLREGRRPSVLYLVGEAPFTERPDCDYLIAQDLYQPPFPVDAFLPAASFSEASGTLTNVEGRVQEQCRVEDLPPGTVYGSARPDWRIFSDLAARLGRPDLEYADAADVRAAIRAELPAYPAEYDRASRRMAPLPAPARAAAGTPAGGAPRGSGRFVLVPERAGFRHRGSDLAGVVEGLGELHLEDGVRMCPSDLERLGVAAGGAVTVSRDGHDLVTAARPDPDCPRGAVYATRVEAWGGLDPAARLPELSHLPAQPVRVRVTAGDLTRKRGHAGDRPRGRTRKGEHGPGR
jgi:Molybdopterin oxidoreductase